MAILKSFIDNENITIQKRIEIMEGKCENAHYQHFLLFQQYLQKSFSFRVNLKVRIVKAFQENYIFPLQYIIQLDQTTILLTGLNSKYLQTTNQILLKLWFPSSIGKKTLWEKEKMLVTSIFSFFPLCFHKVSSPGSGLCCEDLILQVAMLIQCFMTLGKTPWIDKKKMSVTRILFFSNNFFLPFLR